MYGGGDRASARRPPDIRGERGVTAGRLEPGCTEAATEHVLDGHRTCEVNETSQPSGWDDEGTEAATEHLLDGHLTCEVNETSRRRRWSGRRPEADVEHKLRRAETRSKAEGKIKSGSHDVAIHVRERRKERVTITRPRVMRWSNARIPSRSVESGEAII
jgi:hypothetical protein